MNHPSLRDLSEAVHGLAPRPDHADECPECAASVERLEAELALLRRAEARVAPTRGSSRGWRRLPLALAAAILMGVLGWILGGPDGSTSPGDAKRSSQPDLVSRFLDGTPEESERAREELLRRGPLALGSLAEARRKRPDAERADALSALIFELKTREAGERGGELFRKLDRTRITVDMRRAPLSAVLDYLRQISELSIQIEDSQEAVDLQLTDAPLRQALDHLGRLTKLDYAYRWGGLYLAAPEKLWGPAALPLANRWRTQVHGAASQASARSLETMKADLAFESTAAADVISFLREFSSLNVLLEKADALPALSFKMKDAPLGHVLERITLPYGYDVRIEEGAVVLYPRNR